MGTVLACRFVLLLDLRAEVRKINQSLLLVRQPFYLTYHILTSWAVPKFEEAKLPNSSCFLPVSRVMFAPCC